MRFEEQREIAMPHKSNAFHSPFSSFLSFFFLLRVNMPIVSRYAPPRHHYKEKDSNNYSCNLRLRGLRNRYSSYTFYLYIRFSWNRYLRTRHDTRRDTRVYEIDSHNPIFTIAKDSEFLLDSPFPKT